MSLPYLLLEVSFVKIRYFLVVLLSVLLVGCGATPGDENENAPAVILEHQLDALEKAKAVEQTVLDADAKRKSDLEKQGI
jgi:hypothetical protein